MEAFRNLVERVVVHPKGTYRGVDVEVRGHLAALIGGDIFLDKVGGIGGSGGPIHRVPYPCSSTGLRPS
jgi:site-specific DNA recombinase